MRRLPNIPAEASHDVDFRDLAPLVSSETRPQILTHHVLQSISSSKSTATVRGWNHTVLELIGALRPDQEYDELEPGWTHRVVGNIFPRNVLVLAYRLRDLRSVKRWSRRRSEKAGGMTGREMTYERAKRLLTPAEQASLF